MTLLRLLKKREMYDRLIRAVPMDAIESNTATLLRDFGAYFKSAPEAAHVDTSAFFTFFLLQHPKLKAEHRAAFGATIKEIDKPAVPGAEDGILERLVSLTTAAKLQGMIEQFSDGEIDLTAALRVISDRHEQYMMRKRKHPKVKDRIEDLLVAEENDTGLHWRLNCLNAAMKPLRAGDFIIVAAGVDVGKSSFFASELSFMAPQIDTLYPGEERCIMVLNNEGPGKRLKQRFFNATLECDNTALVQKSRAGTVYAEYVKAMGGRDLFDVYDVHDYTISGLEDIVKDNRPALIVVDMPDNVQMDAAVNNGGQRTDQILEAIYQRGRIWAVKYDCAVIFTSQLTAEGSGELFPKLTQLANGRVGKAGAADAVIMIGKSPNPDLENTRFISTPKNKKRRDGGVQNPRKEVSFHGSTALFSD